MEINKAPGSPLWNRFCRRCVHIAEPNHVWPCSGCWNPPGDMYVHSRTVEDATAQAHLLAEARDWIRDTAHWIRGLSAMSAPPVGTTELVRRLDAAVKEAARGVRKD